MEIGRSNLTFASLRKQHHHQKQNYKKDAIETYKQLIKISKSKELNIKTRKTKVMLPSRTSINTSIQGLMEGE